MAKTMSEAEFTDMESRTLVVRNFNSERINKELLEELFSNFGPLKKIVLKNDFAYIEYNHKESVGYALAMMSGIRLHGQRLNLYPKQVNESIHYKFVNSLRQFQDQCRSNKTYLESFLSEEQKKEKSKIIKDYQKSKTSRRQIEDRLRKYRRHFDPDDYNSQFNPYFGLNLIENHDDHHRRDRYHHDHHRPDHDRHRYEPQQPPLPPPLPPPPYQNPMYEDNRYQPPPNYPNTNFQPPPPPLPPPIPNHSNRFNEPFIPNNINNHHPHHHLDHDQRYHHHQHHNPPIPFNHNNNNNNNNNYRHHDHHHHHPRQPRHHQRRHPYR